MDTEELCVSEILIMTKDEFTFTCLLCEYDEDFAGQSLEEQYYSGPKLFRDFEKSDFNEKHLPISDCIERYLLDSEANQLDELDTDFIL